MTRQPPKSQHFPYTTLFRSRVDDAEVALRGASLVGLLPAVLGVSDPAALGRPLPALVLPAQEARAERPPRDDAEAGRAAERRSEEHTSELQSLAYLVCRLLL